MHFVLNEEHSKDALLNSNEVRQLLGRTPRFIPTPKRVDAADIARDCDIFGYRLIKAFNRFARRKYIQHAKNQSIVAGILPWEPVPSLVDFNCAIIFRSFRLDFPSAN